MDVRCPRCQSEYELDDGRVTDDGVTVKCSECQHVFRVKRKSLVMTLPVRDEASAAAAPLPPTAVHREWRVRQPNGNTYLCKELTTLQKWIIERKVARDDEISLTGETWKRLGDIPELASFFQVVDDANKARAFEAMRASQVELPAVPPPPPPPSIPPGARIHETWKEPN
ncbi:MAG: zinc-ribbon domain-containing protein, partial [Myxococcus sp.]|nr:zinc-ribbon domain-containing protein [Myxococcus sp.]